MSTPAESIDRTVPLEGPTFARSIAWMTLTLSIFTVGMGGLFWRADLERNSQRVSAATAQEAPAQVR